MFVTLHKWFLSYLSIPVVKARFGGNNMTKKDITEIGKHIIAGLLILWALVQ